MLEQTTDTAHENGSALAWRVEGMDCASCVAKIQTALGKLPGVTEVWASTMTETLSATVGQTKSSLDEIETRVARLGYTLTRRRALSSRLDGGRWHQRRAGAGSRKRRCGAGDGRRRAPEVPHLRRLGDDSLGALPWPTSARTSPSRLA
jgi:copper chaperone CopZ